MSDARKNLAVSSVATAPSPATSGTSLVVSSGEGSRFPTTPFNATVWPDGELSDPVNAEIVRVTGISTDTLTIVREQESTTARSIVVGDLIAATITVKTLDDIEADLDTHLNDTTDAHDASAISVDSTTLSGTATDVQGTLEELDNLLDDHSDRHENGGADEISLTGLDGTPTALQAHIDDASAAHAASAVSVVSTTLSGTGTDAQAVFEEIDNLLDDHSGRHENGGADEISIAGLDGTPTELTNHLNDTTDAHDASAISYAGSATLSATDVEGALDELDSEKTTAASALSAAQTEIADQRRWVELLVSDPNGDAITTGDGKAVFLIPSIFNGHNLVAVLAGVTTVSSSGAVTVQVRNETQTADMLSTAITIDQSERTTLTAATPAVIDTANDDVATGDFLFIDIDGAGTGAKGLIVALAFEAP